MLICSKSQALIYKNIYIHIHFFSIINASIGGGGVESDGEDREADGGGDSGDGDFVIK